MIMEEKKFMGHRVTIDGKIYGKRNPNVTLKPYFSHGKLALKINRETHYLHRIVADVFNLNGFNKNDKSQIIAFNNGDSSNCSLDNLYVKDLTEHMNDINMQKSAGMDRSFKTSIYPYVYKKANSFIASYRGKYIGMFKDEDDAYYAVEDYKSKLVEMADVPGFKGLYKVNQYGEVYSVRFKKYLKVGAFDGSVSLTDKDGKRVKRSIGLLTYNSFNRKNPVKKVIHLDGDVMNNFLVNLKPEKLCTK
jgi:hypothetical protein